MAISEVYLKAIGRISVNFQSVETLISFFTWSLISPDQKIGMIITSQMSFNRLCVLFGSLVLHKLGHSELTREAEDLLKRAGELEQKRNTIIHSTWITDELQSDKVSRFKITARRKKGLEHQSPEVGVDELNTIADSMLALVGSLIDFMKRAKQTGKIDYPTEPI